MNRSPIIIAFGACALACLGSSACGSSPPPVARPVPSPSAPIAAVDTRLVPPVAAERPVTHTYHGVDVVDPYEWLESATDPAVQAWSDAENTFARARLDAIAGRAAIRARVQEVLAAPRRHFGQLRVRGDKWFALESQPPREQPFIVVLGGPDAPDSAHVVVDPSAIDPTGGTSIDWFDPSPNGVLVAVSLSHGGSERGDLHVFDVATGADQTADMIPHVNGGTAGGDVAWAPDSRGIYYTRYPRPGERSTEDENFFLQVYFHALGHPVAEDRYEIGREFPRIAEINLETDNETGRVLATVANGDGGEFALYVRTPNGRWTPLTTFADHVVQGTFGPHGDVYCVSRDHAPKGKLLRIRAADPRLAHATLLVPESQDSIATSFADAATVHATTSSLYVVYQLGGPSELRAFDLQGHPRAKPDQPTVASIGATVPIEGDDVLFWISTYTSPGAWYRFTALSHETHRTALADTSLLDGSHWQVRREMATSHDGTQVPLNIVTPPGVATDGSAPCLVYGYGGYGVNEEPGFWPLAGILSERGVVWVDVNLRGGGEFGEQWHEQGMLTHKQNVFDDFAAALEYVTAHHITSRDHLAIMGGSNGGLLMGATITQHPDMFHAVVSFVGIYDMLRVELSPNGAFNTTEFGTVQNEDQFRALYAYSPYHHVPRTELPATLFLTGANDPRVEPWHSRKMIARMQASNTGNHPILLRTSANSGHGIGTSLSEEVEEQTDAIAFVLDELRVAAVAPPELEQPDELASLTRVAAPRAGGCC